MVLSEVFAGNFSEKILQNVNTFGVELRAFYVNGEPNPKQPFHINITDSIYLDALLNLCSGTDDLWEDTDMVITRETY